MCGRYYIEDDETIAEMRKIFDEINQRYQNTPQRDAWKTGEIFPTDTAPVLIGEKDAAQPILMKWGYPKWQGSGVIINARAETADEKQVSGSGAASSLPMVSLNGIIPKDAQKPSSCCTEKSPPCFTWPDSTRFSKIQTAIIIQHM